MFRKKNHNIKYIGFMYKSQHAEKNEKYNILFIQFFLFFIIFLKKTNKINLERNDKSKITMDVGVMKFKEKNTLIIKNLASG